MHSSDDGTFASIIPTKVRSRLTSPRCTRRRRYRTWSHVQRERHVLSSAFVSCVALVGNGVKSWWRTLSNVKNDKDFFLYPPWGHVHRIFCRPFCRVTFIICIIHSRNSPLHNQNGEKNETLKIERGLKLYVSSAWHLYVLSTRAKVFVFRRWDHISGPVIYA